MEELKVLQGLIGLLVAILLPRAIFTAIRYEIETRKNKIKQKLFSQMRFFKDLGASKQYFKEIKIIE